jgi:hypothetical protein
MPSLPAAGKAFLYPQKTQTRWFRLISVLLSVKNGDIISSKKDERSLL